MESEKIGIDDLIYKVEMSHRRREQMYGYQGGKGRGWDELGDWDWYIYTTDTMYTIDN